MAAAAVALTAELPLPPPLLGEETAPARSSEAVAPPVTVAAPLPLLLPVPVDAAVAVEGAVAVAPPPLLSVARGEVVPSNAETLAPRELLLLAELEPNAAAEPL